jgi:hypothetical protein
MTIQYKNQGFNLTTTNLTTVLTINTSSVAIVKSMPITNEHNNNVETHAYIHDASAGTDYEFFHSELASDSTTKGVDGALNLEAGDSIKIQVDLANTVNGVISYALIDRSQENG